MVIGTCEEWVNKREVPADPEVIGTNWESGLEVSLDNRMHKILSPVTEQSRWVDELYVWRWDEDEMSDWMDEMWEER